MKRCYGRYEVKGLHNRIGNRVYIIIFMIGLVLGTLYINYVVDRQVVLEMGKTLFFVDNSIDYTSDLGEVIHIGINRIILFIFLSGSALLCRKSLVLCIPTAFFGGCFGVVISMVMLSFENEGIRQLLWYFIPHYMFYIAAFCLLIRMSEHVVRRHQRLRYTLKSGYVGRDMVKLFLLVFTGIMSECYVNQWLIQKFVKNF